MPRPIVLRRFTSLMRSAATHRASLVLADERAARCAVDVLSEVVFEADAAVAAVERPDGQWDVTVDFARAPHEARPSLVSVQERIDAWSGSGRCR